MGRYLKAAVERYDGRLTVVPIVCPLNRGCNGHVTTDSESTRDACVLARLSLAVWYVAPEKYAEYHDWLLGAVDARQAKEARQRAGEVIGESALRKQFDGWRIDQRVRLNVALFETAGTGMIPKLLFRQVVLRGHMKSQEDLFEQLEKELGLTPPASEGEL